MSRTALTISSLAGTSQIDETRHAPAFPRQVFGDHNFNWDKTAA